MTTGGVDPVETRIADSDRERAATLLATAMSEGRISPHEFSDRCGVAWNARTRRELLAVLSDLPGGAPAELAPLVLDVAFGQAHRGGGWVVPELVRIVGAGQRTVLDFTEAVIRHREVVIEVSGHLSSTRVYLPPGVDVDAHALELVAGSVRHRGAPRPVRVERRERTPGRLRRLLPGTGGADEPEPPVRFVLRGRATLASVLLLHSRGPRRR